LGKKLYFCNVIKILYLTGYNLDGKIHFLSYPIDESKQISGLIFGSNASNIRLKKVHFCQKTTTFVSRINFKKKWKRKN